MKKVSKNDIALLKMHDEYTYDKLRKEYINILCLYLKSEFVLTNAYIEDIANDAFIKAAYFKINYFDPNKSDFNTWLFSIAKNEARDYIKLNHLNSFINDGIDIETMPFKNEDHDSLIYDIKEILNEEEFDIFISHVLYGIKINELAIKYNTSKSSINRIIKTAKEKIAKILKK